MIGWGEIILIIAAIILIFGATQIPKIARALGQGLKEFKKAAKEAKDADADEENARQKPKKRK